MPDNEEKKLLKGWKEYFLRSGVPLEYEVAKLLSAESMSIEADFNFSRSDGPGTKEWSVDMGATWYGPSPNKLNYELDILIECKYRSPGKVFIFLEDPGVQFSPVTVGGTVASYDQFIPYILNGDSFFEIEKNYAFVYKGIELHERGAVEEDLRHGIQQLRYASPAFLLSKFDFILHSHDDDKLAVFFTRILVTNAPIRVLKRDVDIATIKSAAHVEDISTETNTIIFYSDYGPDFENHVRSLFRERIKERIEIAEFVEENNRARGKDFKRPGSGPVRFLKDISEANTYELRRMGSQFFVTTLEGLPHLLSLLKQGCRDSFRGRKKKWTLAIRNKAK